MRKQLFMLALLLGATPAMAGGDYSVSNQDTPFYTGAVAGYGWGKVSGEGRNAGERGSEKIKGGYGGIVMGYRATTGTTRIGIEADLLGTGIEFKETSIDEDGDSHTAEFNSNILASLRLKASFGADAIRPYLTGGLALQRLEISVDSIDRTGETDSGSVKKNQVGFYRWRWP